MTLSQGLLVYWVIERDPLRKRESSASYNSHADGCHWVCSQVCFVAPVQWCKCILENTCASLQQGGKSSLLQVSKHKSLTWCSVTLWKLFPFEANATQWSLSWTSFPKQVQGLKKSFNLLVSGFVRLLQGIWVSCNANANFRALAAHISLHNLQTQIKCVNKTVVAW